jgi:hypothetical protein
MSNIVVSFRKCLFSLLSGIIIGPLYSLLLIVANVTYFHFQIEWLDQEMFIYRFTRHGLHGSPLW